MRRKIIKYAIGLAVIGLVAYNSVYFKRLDEVKAARAGKTFNAAAYAETFWDKKLMPRLDSAVPLQRLLPAFLEHPDWAFNAWSHALGIGNLRYFLVQGEGKVTAVDADDITVTLTDLTGPTVPHIRIATEYIFGNAARDATGGVNINDFTNTMDFNNVSAEINRLIRSRVLPVVRTVKPGNLITFTGAIELNKEHLNLSAIEAIPIAIKILP